MAQRHQRGWLKKEKRAQAETWVLFFRTTRQSDGKRVENKVPIGWSDAFPRAVHGPRSNDSCSNQPLPDRPGTRD